MNKNLGKSNLFKIENSTSELLEFQQFDTDFILIHTLKEVLSGKLLKVQIQDDLIFHEDVSETIEKIHNSTFRDKIQV